MTRLVLMATRDGLVFLDLEGQVVRTELAGKETVSVSAGDGSLFAAVRGSGVLRRSSASPGTWQPLGLADANVWVVRAATGGAAYAGVEPAALWKVGGDTSTELVGLQAVEGYSDWHSPWGPADLSTIVVDGQRVIVGVEQGGVAVSEDGGSTWTARNKGLYDDVHAVVADANGLYATTGMGFHRSLDDGETWTWESDGIDRGYTQGLTACESQLFVSSASGPPPMWESGGPDAAIFHAAVADQPLEWTVVLEGFAGNIERQALASADGVVVAGTTEGELIVGDAASATFRVVRSGLPPISSVALYDE